MNPPHFACSVLTTAYLPPVSYFFAIANSDRVLIEQHEAYQKQSWRNRCRILATAGPEDLSIPVIKEERLSRPIRDIRIDYGEPWLQHHIRALDAAYNHSAFYDYYADDLIPLLESKPTFLFDLNQSLLAKLLDLLDLHVPIDFTETYVKDYDGESGLCRPGGAAGSFDAKRSRLHQKGSDALREPDSPSIVLDGRDRIQPKFKGKSLLAEYGCEQAYYQVFVNRFPGQAREDGSPSFIPDLSIIDLLSAEGPDAGAFLRI